MPTYVLSCTSMFQYDLLDHTLCILRSVLSSCVTVSTISACIVEHLCQERYDHPDHHTDHSVPEWLQAQLRPGRVAALRRAVPGLSDAQVTFMMRSPMRCPESSALQEPSHRVLQEVSWNTVQEDCNMRH